MTRPIALTGGTGFIGHAIVAALVDRHVPVIVISRSRQRAQARLPASVRVVEGDPARAGEWQQAIAGTAAVINLAGEPISAQRWDARFKQRVRDSRCDSTRFVVEAIRACEPDQRPAVLVSASGIDYYPSDLDLAGMDDDEADEVDESAPRADNFMGRLCRDWEQEALEARELGVRVVVYRTGLVFGAGGGSLPIMAKPFRWCVGGRLGSGRQWVSWVHLADVVRAYLWAFDGAFDGAANLVAPHPLRQRELAARLGRALGRPSVVPTPAFAVKLAIGELADYALAGRPVVPRALVDAGFSFDYPELTVAVLRELLGA